MKFKLKRVESLRINNYHIFDKLEIDPYVYINISGKYFGGTRFKNVAISVSLQEYRELRLKAIGL